MLETLLFIVTNLAVLYVMYWIIQNDGAARIEDQTGLLRMKPGQQRPAKADRRASQKARRNARQRP